MSLNIYGDESGLIGSKHFLIGLLYVSSRHRTDYERQLQKLKLEHEFTHSELHYTELNRFKLPFAKAAIDWFFGAADAVFKCTVVPGHIQEVPSENHNLLQIVDLLLGCVNGDLNGVQKFEKRAAIDHIKLRLNIGDFRERNHYTKEKFRVNFWKPPRKAA